MNIDCVGRFALVERPVVLFDFDGTLADTGAAVMRTAKAVLAERGIEASPDDLRKLIGPPLVTGFRDTFQVSQAIAEELTVAYRALFDKKVQPSDYPPIPGVPELLDALEQEGRRIAIATSRKEDGARRMVDALGWTHRFECVMGLHEPYRLTKADSIRDALAFMDADAQDAVMIGDRFNDIEGARACGAPVVGVYTGAAQPGEHDAADVACSSMFEVARVLGVA
ncbi:MAG: HAD hydrolase-like protein [Coriobacteriaceae bacterium]|nr:HAD hydrolase-like protein [Coriobacteriaceae bacterium]